MSVIYVPVMAAKRGEFTALSNLQGVVAEKIIPVFELPAKKPDTKIFEKSIGRTAVNAGKAWGGRSAFLDISKWSPNARTETGIHVLEYAFSQFRSCGVVANPIVGYDRWDDPSYSQAVKNIRKHYSATPCIRFDREAVKDDMLDFSYFADRVNEIMVSLDIEPNKCFVMVDLGDVSTASVPDIIENIERAVKTLLSMGFGTVIVVGGSMPDAVNKAVDNRDAEGCIPRIEMMAWKTIFSDAMDSRIVFGDYLIRSPNSVEGVIALDANAKIRYTTDSQYFIVRGHSKREDSLTLQHKNLAKKLVASTCYMGSHFSWGDSEVFNCSIGTREIRDATLMIAVDSNHHISAVVAEVFEHQRQVVASAKSNSTSATS